MTDLTLIWLSTSATVVATVVVFVILARWSAAEPVPWSILPGLSRGVSVWHQGREVIDPVLLISPQAEEPGPRIDMDALPLPPPETVEREPEAWIEEIGTRSR